MGDILDFFIQNWQLSGLFVLVLIAYLVFEYMQTTNSDTITPEEAVLKINHEHGVVIDVRTEAEFKTGHILHAVHVDSTEPDAKFKKLNKYAHKPIILVCASGRRSAQCVQRMKAQGFEKVFTLGGGLQAWKDAGLPLI